MYLSRVQVDRENRKKMKNLAHAGAIHSWVEQSFPQELERRVRSRKLWRLDRLNGREYLLVVSDTQPELKELEAFGVQGTAQCKEYSPFLNTLTSGMKMGFRVTLNPVVAISNPDGKRGRVVPHVTVEQQMDFLRQRAERNGFILEDGGFTIVERGYVEFRKSGQKPIKLSKATYEGILTISDEDCFRKMLTEGIGKKKAYGFGLMTIVPLK